MLLPCSVGDPDPNVFGPAGSGSGSIVRSVDPDLKDLSKMNFSLPLLSALKVPSGQIGSA
jgi:hypothetical protein